MAEHLTPHEELLLRKQLARASEQGWGLAFGAICGAGLFVATVWLVVLGGENQGQHLGLLGIYFPGYTVSWFGSVLGFVYAFVCGYAVGRTVATLYNGLLPH